MNNTQQILKMVESANIDFQTANETIRECQCIMREELAGKCFIYKTECTTIIANAESIRLNCVKGRAVSLDDNCGLLVQDEVYIDAIGLVSLTIISEADFERIYNAAVNIDNDHQRQIDEFNNVINSIKPINQ